MAIRKMKQKIFRERRGDVDGIVPGIFLSGRYTSRTFELCDSSQPPCIRIRAPFASRSRVSICDRKHRVRNANSLRQSTRGKAREPRKGTRTEREFARWHRDRFKREPKFREFS